MKAVILAGGFGSRLKRVIYDRPTSMAPIAGIPFLEHQIRLLKEQGIIEIILCVSFMAGSIKSYFGDGKKLGVKITYSEEEIPLGTGGAIKKAEKYIDDTFLVLNGDSYSQIDIKKFLEFHRIHGEICTMALTKTKYPGKHGSAILEGNKIKGFMERKLNQLNFDNSGVYIFQPEIFNYIEKEKNISLESEIFHKIAKEEKLVGYHYDGYYLDIGLPETYKKFKEDVLKLLFLKRTNSIREVMNKIDRSGIKVVLVVDEEKRLQGMVTERKIIEHLLRGGNLDDEIWNVMDERPIVIRGTTPKEEIDKIFKLGNNFIPVLNNENIVVDVEFFEEETERKSFPIVRGRAPLRISFAGGGTDLSYFFERYGGAVVNATINKYTYATIIKRADNKIIINSDFCNEIIADSIGDLKYDNQLDIVKSTIKIMNPNFGFELIMHNDLPPGRGLGSSACLVVLIINLLNSLMDLKYDDYKIAELAYKVEREEMKIKGGWQDQYSTISGGFNYMEFSKDSSLIYPLKLKKEIVNELNAHLLLCYIGKSRESSTIHESQEKSFFEDEETKVKKLKQLKELTYEVRKALLTNHLETFGRLLNESWIIKKSLSKKISNDAVEKLYEVGMNNGAYGGRLLGAGEGGYLLFFYSQKRRNELTKALIENGGEILDFDFDLEGTKIWTTNNRF